MKEFFSITGIGLALTALALIIFITGYAVSERDYKDQVRELKQTLEIRDCQLKNCLTLPDSNSVIIDKATLEVLKGYQAFYYEQKGKIHDTVVVRKKVKNTDSQYFFGKKYQRGDTVNFNEIWDTIREINKKLELKVDKENGLTSKMESNLLFK